MKMLLLLSLFLCLGQAEGQNLQYFPCDTCPSIGVVKDFGALSQKAKRAWNTAGFFDISDVDRYLRECYADSEIVVKPDNSRGGFFLRAKKPDCPERRFKTMSAAINYIGYSKNTCEAYLFAIEIRHREPTFDDFKKWLRRK